MLEHGTDEFDPIGHGWTYSAHPICTAVGVANLKLIDERDLVANAGAVGAYLKAGMQEALGAHPYVGEIRGEGMLCAVELTADRETRANFEPAVKAGPSVVAGMLERNVIARAMPQGDIIGLAPPMCLTRAEADIVIAATKGALDDFNPV